jgi:hypothetical protein
VTRVSVQSTIPSEHVNATVVVPWYFRASTALFLSIGESRALFDGNALWDKLSARSARKSASDDAPNLGE